MLTQKTTKQILTKTKPQISYITLLSNFQLTLSRADISASLPATTIMQFPFVGFGRGAIPCIPVRISVQQHHYRPYVQPITALRPKPGFSAASSEFNLTLILRRSRTRTVWFYTSTSNKRAARPKLYTKSLTRDLKLMYIRLTLVRISNTL